MLRVYFLRSRDKGQPNPFYTLTIIILLTHNNRRYKLLNVSTWISYKKDSLIKEYITYSTITQLRKLNTNITVLSNMKSKWNFLQFSQFVFPFSSGSPLESHISFSCYVSLYSFKTEMVPSFFSFFSFVTLTVGKSIGQGFYLKSPLIWGCLIVSLYIDSRGAFFWHEPYGSSFTVSSVNHIRRYVTLWLRLFTHDFPIVKISFVPL